MFRSWGLFVRILVVAVLVYAHGTATAQDGRGYKSPKSSSSAYPWNYPDYRGYNEPPTTIMPSGSPGQPQKYQIYVNALPEEYKADPNAAQIVAHVPDNAAIWFQDDITTSKGTLREFRSPRLELNKRYVYTVRVSWVEDGKLVSETQDVSVKAGAINCVYLMEAKATLGQKSSIDENLAKLSPDDRKLAEKQEFCAVQNGIKLGAMGTPVKITVKDQPVFLCCESCRARAEKDPEGTLANATRKAKAKEESPPSK
jgi:uncharacterized protein (TIGR03000 family)